MLQEAVLAQRGFLGLSGGEEAGPLLSSAAHQARATLPPLFLFLTSHSFPSSLTTLCWSTQAICCLCFPSTWCCLFGMPWPPPQVLAVPREICFISVTSQFPSARCLLCGAAHQEHPGTVHRLCSPCPPFCSAPAPTDSMELHPMGMKK